MSQGTVFGTSSLVNVIFNFHTSCNIQLHEQTITRFDIEHDNNDTVVLTFALIFRQTLEEQLKQDIQYPTRDLKQIPT
jgi:hypothetical protein